MSTGLVVRTVATTVGLGALLVATPWALRVEGDSEDPMLEFSLTQTGPRATPFQPGDPSASFTKSMASKQLAWVVSVLLFSRTDLVQLLPDVAAAVG